jgi:hypothetical protein
VEIKCFKGQKPKRFSSLLEKRFGLMTRTDLLPKRNKREKFYDSFQQ